MTDADYWPLCCGDHYRKTAGRRAHCPKCCRIERDAAGELRNTCEKEVTTGGPE